MKNQDRSKTVTRVTVAGMLVNLVLTVAKIVAGIVGRSAAMLADGFHSLSDIITDLVVLTFVRMSGKESDETHHYGHGKYETFATMIISFALLVVGVAIFWESLQKVYGAINGEVLAQPGSVALWAALVSIVVKEWLFRWTRLVGQRIDSSAVVANAWHHRSDALSSIGTALGISGAIFLGESWRVLDPIAGMVVSVFIIKVAWDLGVPSIRELLEATLPDHVNDEIVALINDQHGVKSFHRLKTRKIGNVLAVEVHVKVDKGLSVEASHEIATAVEQALRRRFGNQTHVGVHIEPYYEK
ncbi:MAG TPA: cation diffusion facilitator family transporter [Bacteroidales bacterium]|nr:cation diffusion facilitator family transporter [Bacteroidales bacterium]